MSGLKLRHQKNKGLKLDLLKLEDQNWYLPIMKAEDLWYVILDNLFLSDFLISFLYSASKSIQMAGKQEMLLHDISAVAPNKNSRVG